MATNQPAPHDWNVRATVEPFRSSEHPTMAFLDITWTDKINGDRPWLRSQRIEILPIPVAQAIAQALSAYPKMVAAFNALRAAANFNPFCSIGHLLEHGGDEIQEALATLPVPEAHAQGVQNG